MKVMLNHEGCLLVHNKTLSSDLQTAFDPPSAHMGFFSLAVCERGELWPWQTLKDKPSELLSYIHV